MIFYILSQNPELSATVHRKIAKQSPVLQWRTSKDEVAPHKRDILIFWEGNLISISYFFCQAHLISPP